MNYKKLKELTTKQFLKALADRLESKYRSNNLDMAYAQRLRKLSKIV